VYGSLIQVDNMYLHCNIPLEYTKGNFGGNTDCREFQGGGNIWGGGVKGGNLRSRFGVKETGDIISSSPFIEWNVLFTTELFKPLSDQG